MTIMSLIFSLISTLLLMLALTLTKSSMKDREKLTPFECGFDPSKKARMPFSIRFFMVTIIFLIFDVEIAILMPLPMMFNMTNIMHMYSVMTAVVIILIMGLLHEWNQSALNWT